MQACKNTQKLDVEKWRKEDSIYLLLGNYLVLAAEKMIEFLINPEKCLKVNEKPEKPAEQEEENERTWGNTAFFLPQGQTQPRTQPASRIMMGE